MAASILRGADQARLIHDKEPRLLSSRFSRVLVRAAWEARDLAAGKSQWLMRHTVPLALGALENDLYGNGLNDPTTYDEIYERELLVELVERRIDEDHRDEIRQVFKMLRQGYIREQNSEAIPDGDARGNDEK